MATTDKLMSRHPVQGLTDLGTKDSFLTLTANWLLQGSVQSVEQPPSPLVKNAPWVSVVSGITNVPQLLSFDVFLAGLEKVENLSLQLSAVCLGVIEELRLHFARELPNCCVKDPPRL